MKHVLLVNDDGYQSAGFLPLLVELSKHYEVTVVAPKSEKSWVGKSMSAHNDIPFEKMSYKGHDIFVIDGTPADCPFVTLEIAV